MYLIWTLQNIVSTAEDFTLCKLEISCEVHMYSTGYGTWQDPDIQCVLCTGSNTQQLVTTPLPPPVSVTCCNTVF